MNKILLLFFIFLSSSAFGAGTSSDSTSQVDNSDQIKILYEKAENYIEDDNYKKSLKVLKALTKR